MVMRKDCLTFSYTSGTTGDPKAAMMSHANFISVLATLKHHPSIKLYPEDIHLSYLPMPHVFERVFIYACLS
jgi:long-chain acyl-CoA synthetase